MISNKQNGGGPFMYRWDPKIGNIYIYDIYIYIYDIYIYIYIHIDMTYIYIHINMLYVIQVHFLGTHHMPSHCFPIVCQ